MNATMPDAVREYLASIGAKGGKKGGRKGGRARTRAKIAAARRNGKLGGRPRKATTEIQQDENYDLFKAVHEAGHAVAAVKLRLPFDRVEIHADAHGAGGGLTSRPLSIRAFREVTLPSGETTFKKTDEEGVFIEHSRKYLVMLFAGMAAQRRVMRWENAEIGEQEVKWGGGNDLGMAEETARIVFGVSAEKMPAFLSRFEKRAERMMQKSDALGSVLLVYRELLSKRTLSEKDVKVLCRKMRLR